MQKHILQGQHDNKTITYLQIIIKNHKTIKKISYLYNIREKNNIKTEPLVLKHIIQGKSSNH